MKEIFIENFAINNMFDTIFLLFWNIVPILNILNGSNILVFFVCNFFVEDVRI